MAFLFSGPAADPSQPKRRNARLLQPGQTPSTVRHQRAECQQAKAPQPTSDHGVARTRLIPLTDWNQHHAWPPIGGLRHLVFFERTNGFDKVVRRVGRRVLIDEAAFFAWVDGNGGAK